jgi:hypothetical protein
MPTPTPETLTTLLAIVLLLAVFDRARRHLWLFVPLVLPATLLHEGSHWLVASVSGARPSRFSVWPRREAGRIVLGEVAIARPNWLTRGLVGLAPLLLLPIALLVMQHAPRPASPALHALQVYLLASLLYGAIPSWSDLKLALRGLPGALIVLAVLAASFYGLWLRAAS